MSNLSPAASALFNQVYTAEYSPDGGTYQRVFTFADGMARYSREAGEWETARHFREIARHVESVALELAN